MTPWAPVIVTLLVNLVACVFVYGKLTQKVSGLNDRVDGHDEDFKAVREGERLQWAEINHSLQGVAKIKGKLGINGGSF